MAAAKGNDYAGKGNRWAKAIEAAMLKMDQSRLDGWNTMQAVAKSLVDAALAGDIAAIKEIGDRIDGKSKQQIDLSDQNGNPLHVLLLQISNNSQHSAPVLDVSDVVPSRIEY